MAVSETRGVRIWVPDDWEDQSIAAFAAPERGQAYLPNISVLLEALEENETLEAFANRTLRIRKSLPEFDILDRRTGPLGGQRAFYLRFAFRTKDDGDLVQTVVICEPPPSDARPKGMVAVVNMIASKQDYGMVYPYFARFLSTVRFY